MIASRTLTLPYTAFLLVVAGSAAGAPPNIVQSDSNHNTAMGSGVLANTTTAYFNTGAGSYALNENTSGGSNTGYGLSALRYNTSGSENTALGRAALLNNRTGNYNTAVGSLSLTANTAGNNSALGFGALRVSTSGIDNTALGANAMLSNTTGFWNTAAGSRALQLNQTGVDNTAIGFAALDSSNGQRNTAIGSRAMFYNTAGNYNTAVGYTALYNNTSGTHNVAIGYEAGLNVTTGVRNVALGHQAGYAVTGSDNITIGGANQGNAGDAGVIRIGAKAYQKRAFIAGISGVKTGLAAATAVFVDTNGQLGTIKSSRKYKQDIKAMGTVSERVLALRPVTFRYKQAYDNGTRPVEFGLVAEEVAAAFPELVVRDAQGKPETVRYDLLATLLVNEFQKDHKRLAELEKQVGVMNEVLAGMKATQQVAMAR